MTSNDQRPQGFKRWGAAFCYSWAGLRAAWCGEAAFRQEVVLCLVLLPLAFWLGEDGVERALLAFSALLLPLVELINSAIETTVDRFGREQHRLSGQAKDLGSAAVLLALVLLVVVWSCVLLG